MADEIKLLIEDAKNILDGSALDMDEKYVLYRNLISDTDTTIETVLNQIPWQ